MSEPRTSTGRAMRRRLAWALFWAVAVLGLGAGVVAALASGTTTTAVVVLVGGLLAIGIAALLVSAIASPIPAREGNAQVPQGSRGTGGGGRVISG